MGGLYKICLHRQWSRSEFEADPAFNDPTNKFGGCKPGTKHFVFEPVPVAKLQKYRGRLVIGWSGGIHGSRSWSRPGDSNPSNGFRIFAIHPRSVFADDQPTPDRREVSLSTEQTKAIPKTWKIDFAQWRAIYLATDLYDGKCYVGSGGGDVNSSGRWRDHHATGATWKQTLHKPDP